MDSFSSCKYLPYAPKNQGVAGPYGKVRDKYPVRPLCESCGQRPKAINCHRQGRTYYRRRCESCNRKNKRIKPAEPRWKLAGYKKKTHCDRCGFKAKQPLQLLVYHVDGNLNNSELRNLKTICLNCTVEIKRSDPLWQPGDLEPDF